MDYEQSLWNFDGAELYLIFDIKEQISIKLDSWELDEAYWKLRSLRRELDAKLKRKEKKIIEDFYNELEDEKAKAKGEKIDRKKEKSKTEKETVDDFMDKIDKAFTSYKEKSVPTDNDKITFYKELEDFYIFLCFIMKQHGLYFREGEDMRLAVLRR